MPKLFIGAFGTLGCLVIATLRLSPLPETIAFLKAAFKSMEEGFLALNKLFLSKLILTYAFLCQSRGELHLFIRIEGGKRLVADQIDKTKTILNPTNLEKFPEEKSTEFLSLSEKSIVCSGFLPPTSFHKLYKESQALSLASNMEPEFLFSLDGAFQVGWKTDSNQKQGQVPISASAPPPSKLGPVPNFQKLNRVIAEGGGWVLYEKAPEELWRDWPWWGEERMEWGLTRRIKELFDPKEILNRERYLSRGTGGS